MQKTTRTKWMTIEALEETNTLKRLVQSTCSNFLKRKAVADDKSLTSFSGLTRSIDMPHHDILLQRSDSVGIRLMSPKPESAACLQGEAALIPGWLLDEWNGSIGMMFESEQIAARLVQALGVLHPG